MSTSVDLDLEIDCVHVDASIDYVMMQDVVILMDLIAFQSRSLWHRMEEAGAGASSTASAASASSPTLPQERRARPRPRRRHRGRLGRHSAVVPMLSVVLLVLLQSIVPAAGFSSLQLPCSSRRLSRELLGNWMCRAKRRTTTSARWLAPLPIPEEEGRCIVRSGLNALCVLSEIKRRLVLKSRSTPPQHNNVPTTF